MTEFFLVIAFILILILWIKQSRASRKIKMLEQLFDNLSEKSCRKKTAAAFELPEPEKESEQAASAAMTAARPITTSVPQKTVSVSEEKVQAEPVKPVRLETPVKPSAPKTETAEIKKPKQKPAFLVKLEKQLIENWTGILGAAILVMGVGFLAIYAALSFAPVFRSAMVFSVSTVLFAAWFVLRRMNKWIKFARWMRSSSGAVLIFAALGAGGIPGLKFIDNQWIAFALLIAGIIVNLTFGYLGGTQYFASLHSLISLAALAAAPQSQVTFVIAGVIVFASIMISFREKWEYHLLLCITSFFAYHLYWHFYGASSGAVLPHSLRITGIVTTLVVGLSAIASHYRRLYKSSTFECLPFIVHLLNWSFLGIGLLFYSTGSKWNCIIIAVAVVIVFFLARHARSLGIRWLYVTDILISQSLAVFSLLLLSRWGIDTFIITGLIFAEAVLFLIVMIFEGDWITKKIGVLLYHVSIIVFGFTALETAALHSSSLKYPSVIGAVFLLLLVFHLWLRNREGESFDSFSSYVMKKPDGRTSAGGILIPLIAYLLFHSAGSVPFISWISCGIAVLLLFIRQRTQANGIGAGLCIMIPALFIETWVNMFDSGGPAAKLLIHSLPMFITAVSLTVWSRVDAFKVWIRLPGVYLFTIHLIITGYLATEAAPPIVRSVTALVIALIYLESARFIRALKKEKLTYRGNTDRFILHGAYFFAALFLALHFTIDLQYESYLGPVHTRLAVQLFALAAFLYWATVERHASSPAFRSWTHLKPLLWETLIVFSTVPAMLELPDTALPVVWAAYAQVLLFAGRFISRMRLYSLFFFWFAVFDTAFVLNISDVPSKGFPASIFIIAGATVLFSIIFAVRWFSEAKLDSIDAPPPVRFMLPIAREVMKIRNIAVYYILAAVIMFAIQRFTAPVSPFLPGCLWLIVSIMYLELARFLAAKSGARCAKEGFIDSCMIKSGIAFVLAFIIRHILVHLQSEAHVGIIPLRFSIGLFALAVILYWSSAKSPAHGKDYAVWKYFIPLFTDLAVIFSMLILLVEIPDMFHSFVWIAGALMLLLIGSRFSEVSRLRLYSLFFHWITIFIVSFLLVSDAVSISHWYSGAKFIGAATLFFQIIFVILFYQKGFLDTAEFPRPLAFLGGMSKALSKKRNLAVFYPLFAGMAIFIYTAFDPSLHTLLWVLESFVIFVISVILRENHFRFLSMGTLGICLIRLIAHDLSSSGTVVKGVVFVCVGLLMLAMNVIYNKYRSRF
jgi:hypothetical protein